MKKRRETTYVRQGMPVSAKWANDLVGAVKDIPLDRKQHEYVREPSPNAFAPVNVQYITTGIYSGLWEFQMIPGYLVEHTERFGMRLWDIKAHGGNVTGRGDFFLSNFPTMYVEETGVTLCVHADTRTSGTIYDSHSTRPDTGAPCAFISTRLVWVTGNPILDLLFYDESNMPTCIDPLGLGQNKLSDPFIPTPKDEEIISPDQSGQDGALLFPILGIEGTTGVDGNMDSITFIEYNPNNIHWFPSTRQSHRDAYTTGVGCDVLVANEEGKQEQSQPFYFRSVTGSGGIDVDYYGANSDTLMVSYTGKPPEATGQGTIYLVESGNTGILLSSSGGFVSSISNRTVYARDYNVCDPDTGVTSQKTFLLLN